MTLVPVDPERSIKNVVGGKMDKFELCKVVASVRKKLEWKGRRAKPEAVAIEPEHELITAHECSSLEAEEIVRVVLGEDSSGREFEEKPDSLPREEEWNKTLTKWICFRRKKSQRK